MATVYTKGSVGRNYEKFTMCKYVHLYKQICTFLQANFLFQLLVLPSDLVTEHLTLTLYLWKLRNNEFTSQHWIPGQQTHLQQV